MHRSILIGLLSLVIAPAAWAQTFVVDGVHTTLLFRIKHLDVSYTYGRINDPTGSLKVEDGHLVSIEVNAKAENVDTNNEQRDKHLRSPDFFDVNQFPDMGFKSTKIEPAGDNKYNVTGEFTLHGVTKEITVELTKTGEAEHPQAGHRIGYEGAFTIKRSDYGMDKLIPGASDEVNITVSVEGIKE
jgi:polyisoprenoid-binding protein YceI